MRIQRISLLKRLLDKTFHTMGREYSTWQEAKAKYLEGDIEIRRQHYFCDKDYVTLEEIPTWTEQSKKVSSVSNRHDIKPNSEINSKISLWQGDITVLEIGAIVNAANSRLAGGGGVDGAIHKAAGSFLLQECQSIDGGCPTGQAKLTGAYRLPAKYVIHTVGPMKKDSELLSSCYTKSLELACQNNQQSIAFPCISTGVYGYPNRDAAEVALSATRNYLDKNASLFDRVIFCVFLDKDLKIYEELLPEYFPTSSS